MAPARSEDVRDLGVAGRDRKLARRAPADDRMPHAAPVQVDDAARDEQAHAIHMVVARGPDQGVLRHLLGCQVRGSQARMPGTARAPAEAVLQQQLEMAATRVERAVVDRLRIVRVGPRLEQGDRELLFELMRRRIALTLSERPGERRERVHALPQVARVGIGAMLQEQASNLERRVAGLGAVEARVRRVQQRLPAMRPAFRPRRRRIGGEEPSRGRDVPHTRRGVDARPRDLRVLAQQFCCPPPAGRVVVRVDQAGEAQELVGQLVVAADGAANLLSVRRARIALDDLDMPAQPVPAREAVAAGDDELGVGT